MLLRRLSASGLLSFGPVGVDLPLERLNVLIGPNGSGKSNFLDVLALLRATPNSLASLMRQTGGVSEWFWKGSEQRTGRLSVQVVNSKGMGDITHELFLADSVGRLEVLEELISSETRDGSAFSQRKYHVGVRDQSAKESGKEPATFANTSIRKDESVLSQIKDPTTQRDFDYLQRHYSGIRIFRDWEFGPKASIRRASAPDSPNDYLLDDGSNVDLVLSTLTGANRRQLVNELSELYPGIEDFRTPIGNNTVMLNLEEQSGRLISKARLSDGTLRYICLLTILLHPSPPPFVAIEEPELGLHPDVLPHLGRLIKDASQKMQLVVTTHSQILLDAFTSTPEDIVVCQKIDGQTQFKRLDRESLDDWLEEHSIGELWNMGLLGGNRW